MYKYDTNKIYVCVYTNDIYVFINTIMRINMILHLLFLLTFLKTKTLNKENNNVININSPI